jgi:hypothetical protein
MLSCAAGDSCCLSRGGWQQQDCCDAASDLPEFVRVQPALAEIAEVVAEFLLVE